MNTANCQLPMADGQARPACRQPRGFTLIEMLVVIAIIGILAALIVGLTSSSGAAKVRSRVKTELAALETVIGKYHKELGFYPQDHSQMPPPLAPWTTNQLTPLYYELTGTAPGPVPPAVLGIRGTVNSGPNGENGKNFA